MRSIYRVVRDCHYNVGNVLVQLLHNGHRVITVFQYLQRFLCQTNQDLTYTCPLLGRLRSKGASTTYDL
jgi:hypothetical protein